MPETRVLIVANTLLARTGLATLLNTQQEIEVVGQVAASDEDLLNDLDIYRPDVTLIDLGYEPATMLAYVSMLVEAQMPLLILLQDDESAYQVLTALADAPIYGLLLRDSQPRLLAQAAIAVYAGLLVIDPKIANTIVGAKHASSLPPDAPYVLLENLTPRESEVLQLLSRGLTNKAIAQSLEISTNTVKFHVNAILSKLDAQSRTEAVVRATQMGLIML